MNTSDNLAIWNEINRNSYVLGFMKHVYYNLLYMMILLSNCVSLVGLLPCIYPH